MLNWEKEKTTVIFPEDGFVDFYNGSMHQAGACEVIAPLEQIPVFIKPGAVIPYNYYADGVIPTWEKDNYTEAVLLTAPKYERETSFYTDDASITFTSVLTDEGFRVVSSTKCNRRMIIVIGKAKINADAEITERSYDRVSNRTTAVLSEDWTILEVKKC